MISALILTQMSFIVNKKRQGNPCRVVVSAGKQRGGSAAELCSAREDEVLTKSASRICGAPARVQHKLKIQLLVSELFSIYIRQYNRKISIVHSAFSFYSAAMEFGYLFCDGESQTASAC